MSTCPILGPFLNEGPGPALFLAILWPLAGALLVGLASRLPNLRDTLSFLTALSLFAFVVTIILPAGRGSGDVSHDILEVLPGLTLRLRLEPLGLLFALVASGLWIITSLYAVGYMRGHGEKHQTRFAICFALAIAGALGVAFAGNVFTLFVFYEAITISTYPLVTHAGTEQARRSGRLYLGILMGTSVAFLLLALAWTWHLAGTTEFTPGGILAGKASPAVLTALLALYAFGTGKAALMPFHRWLPAAMVAPTPVSALLHAVAVVKAGVFTVVKVIVYIFGLDLMHEIGGDQWLAWVAAFTMLSAACVALSKDNLKARLAYSTISQLAYIVFGAALATDHAVLGSALHIAMHAFGKITLFFCAGAILVATHKSKVSELAGLGRRMPFTFGAFTLGAFSIIGLPPLGGSWSKWYLALGTMDVGDAGDAGGSGRPLMLGVLLLSSLLAVGYLMPVIVTAFFGQAEEDKQHSGHGSHGNQSEGGLREAPLLCVLPPVVSALGCLALFYYADELVTILKGALLP
ncbi:MAG: proton-conducting transporter membrane subunit [Planctomycetota bacterium]|jgi:multicomponent Na+:H+ antiporter subunit D|nr:proton-conducting transporter membrane subunit [Planctomycetota bacterium]